MKLCRLKKGIGIEHEGDVYVLHEEDWDTFVNDDSLLGKLKKIIKSGDFVGGGKESLKHELEAPIRSQELWAAGVTYTRSKVGRQEESSRTGGGDFYARVYEAERPELFFKANANRIVGPGKPVRIRKDSTWNVPEPELTLMITSHGRIVGYTIGNDMSSRSIEGENPLYLPQAKTYDGCASIGPCIYVTEDPLSAQTVIRMEIIRAGSTVLDGSVELGQMNRKLESLVSYLYRECSFPFGSLLMTGTGIVPSSEFTLQSGDKIRITIDSIGTLENTVA